MGTESVCVQHWTERRKVPVSVSVCVYVGKKLSRVILVLSVSCCSLAGSLTHSEHVSIGGGAYASAVCLNDRILSVCLCLCLCLSDGQSDGCCFLML